MLSLGCIDCGSFIYSRVHNLDDTLVYFHLQPRAQPVLASLGSPWPADSIPLVSRRHPTRSLSSTSCHFPSLPDISAADATSDLDSLVLLSLGAPRSISHYRRLVVSVLDHFGPHAQMPRRLRGKANGSGMRQTRGNLPVQKFNARRL